MARLFEDGFDHYGSDETNMADGVYAHVGSGGLSTAFPGTGTHGYLIDTQSFNSEPGGLRKVLPTAQTKMGVMVRLYIPAFAPANTVVTLMEFNSSDPRLPHVTVFVDANGCLRFYRGSDHRVTGGTGTLIAQSDPIIVPSAQNHVEVQIYNHDTAGWVRAAVNGVHRFEATGLDTAINSDGIVSITHHIPYWGSSGGINKVPFYIDDLVYYNFVGDSTVDTDFCPPVDAGGLATGYIGDLQVMWLPPNADTAEDDWVPSSGSDAYAMVDETAPDDSDYIYSTAVNDLTELALTDLPEDITYIRGLTVWARASKSDAGVAMIKLGMKSVASTTDAPERPLTVEPTYWWDQVNVDPDSSARWTRASLNAAWMRITRSQ